MGTHMEGRKCSGASIGFTLTLSCPFSRHALSANGQPNQGNGGLEVLIGFGDALI